MDIFKETEVLVAFISSTGQVLAALVAALAAGMIGKTFADRKRLMAKLEAAKQDILFMLEVERQYGIRMLEHEDTTLKNSVRQVVREEFGLVWSGRNTPSRL